MCVPGMEQAPIAQAEHAQGDWDYGGGFGDTEDVAVFLAFLDSQEQDSGN